MEKILTLTIIEYVIWGVILIRGTNNQVIYTVWIDVFKLKPKLHCVMIYVSTSYKQIRRITISRATMNLNFDPWVSPSGNMNFLGETNLKVSLQTGAINVLYHLHENTNMITSPKMFSDQFFFNIYLKFIPFKQPEPFVKHLCPTSRTNVNWLDLWPTDRNINRDYLLIKDYLPTKFEASLAKYSWVIRYKVWETNMTFDNDLNFNGFISSRTTSLACFNYPSTRLRATYIYISADMCNAICPSFFNSVHNNYIQWWFINPGSDSPEISLVRTKTVGTNFHVRTNGRFSNPENLLIRKNRPGTNVSG